MTKLCQNFELMLFENIFLYSVTDILSLVPENIKTNLEFATFLFFQQEAR